MKQFLAFLFALAMTVSVSAQVAVKYNSSGQLSEPSVLKVPTGKEVRVESGGTFTMASGSTASLPSNVFTWASISKTGSSLADLVTRSATDLTSGTLPDARFPATLPALNGSLLTALNATQLTSGTVPDARFPATLPALNGSLLTALNATQLTSGTIPDARFPATLPALSGTNLTALNASALASGTVPAARMPALTGDVTTVSGAVAATLATVNSNVGTFGSATALPSVTVNAKGLVTAVSNVTVTPAFSSVTGTALIAQGGTSATTVAGARTNLVVDGTWDARWYGAASGNTNAANSVAIQAAVDAANPGQLIIVPPDINYDPTAVLLKGRRLTNYSRAKFQNSYTFTSPAGGTAAHMTVADGFLYVTEYSNNKVAVFSLTDPSNPRLIVRFNVGSNPRDIRVVGRFAFVACHGASAVQVYDLTLIGSPNLVGTISTGGNPKTLEIVGNQLFVACNSGTLERYTIKALTGSTLTVSAATTASMPSAIDLNFNPQNGIMAVTKGSGDSVYLTSTFTLTPIATITNATKEFSTVKWIGDRLYVADRSEGKIYVYDGQYGSGTLITSITVSAFPEQMLRVGDFLYVANLSNPGATSKLDVVDISKPDAPVLVESISLSCEGAGFLAYYNGYIYVTAHFGNCHMEIVKVGEGSIEPYNRARLIDQNGMLIQSTYGDLIGNVTGDLTGNVTGNVTGALTGNASTATILATARNIYGNSFNGSAALTQIIASTFGGTGNGFTAFTGPTSSEKVFTLPNSSATLLYNGMSAASITTMTGDVVGNISNTAGVTVTSTTSGTRTNVVGHTGRTDQQTVAGTSGTKFHAGVFSNEVYLSNNYFYDGGQNTDNSGLASSSMQFGSDRKIKFRTAAASATPAMSTIWELDGAAGTGTLTGVLIAGSGPTTVTDSAGKVLSAALNTVAVAQGGTGQTSYTNGQLLIGNTTGNTLTKATLTAGTGISITNGTGSITIANASAATTPLSAYSAGTVYSLTASDALLDFGTTDPTITIATPGTYLIMGRAFLKYNAATYVANQTATVHLRRTNNTAADVSNGTTTATLRIVSGITDTVGVMPLPPVIYTTANSDDVISLFGSLSATPSVGSVDCTEASIVAIRLY